MQNRKRGRITVMLLISQLFICSFILAQDQNKDFEMIKKIFFRQQEDWNRGDIDAFMEAYWNSDELQFGGARGITRGWQKTLEQYKSSYPNKASMGQLTFRIKDMTLHSDQVVSLTGSWNLERSRDRPGGHFLLIWRKIQGEWKIVVDHTSQLTDTQRSKTLDFIYSISGKKTLAGQHNKEPNADPDRWTRFIKETTGKYPAHWSGDFLFQQENMENRWKMIREAEKQWEKGEIINLMWHATGNKQR